MAWQAESEGVDDDVYNTINANGRIDLACQRCGSLRMGRKLTAVVRLLSATGYRERCPLNGRGDE